MAVCLPNRSHPIASVRLDWLTFTTVLHHDVGVSDLLHYWDGMDRKVMPHGDGPKTGPSRFYAARTVWPSGIRMQYTIPESNSGRFPTQKQKALRNAGLATIDVPGSIWGFLDLKERSELILDVRNWLGFKKVTRMDLQTTLLNPVQDAEFIVRETAAGRLWPKGFGIGMAYANRNLHGDLHGACCQYYGAKTSRIQSRHYDKAAEAGWDVPAVRHEVQLREEQADQRFRQLADRCQAESSVGPLLMTAEATSVRDALGTLVDFRDTSRWEGRRKPQNWARTAQVPDWWKEIVGPAPSVLEVEYRPPSDLEGAYKRAQEQYGRKLALGAFLAMLDRPESFPVYATRFFLECAAGLTDDEWTILHQLRPTSTPAELRQWLATNIARAQAAVDAIAKQAPVAPPY